jgi:hypothetical protein
MAGAVGLRDRLGFDRKGEGGYNNSNIEIIPILKA